MKFILLTTFISLFSLLALGAPLEPDSESHQLEKRVGPSGKLIFPVGGTQIDSKSGRGKFTVEYQQVSQPNAQTLSISISLEDPTPPGPVLGYATNLASPSKTGNIKQTFLVQGCGEWRFTVVERQLYKGNIITFQSAAPLVNVVDCGPNF